MRQTTDTTYRGYLYAASKDVSALQLLMTDIDRHVEVIAFHAQQAGEKMLKSVYEVHGASPPRTHNLAALLAEAGDVGWLVYTDDDIRSVTHLSQYAVLARYATSPSIERGEALEAVACCAAVSDLLDKNGYVTIPVQDSASCAKHPAQMSLDELPAIIVLVGHAGVGKTNTAVGLALALARAGRAVTLADADVVNPYFRSSDYGRRLRDAGVRVIAPAAAGTTLDTPSLTGELDAAIEQAAAGETHLIVDVGGDDDGATAIGRWGSALTDAGAYVAYAVSAFREPGGVDERIANAVRYVRDIEAAGHLRASGVLNTSNLGAATTAADVASGRAFARSVADAAGLPLVATVVAAHVADEVAATVADGEGGAETLVSLGRYVVAPWETPAKAADALRLLA